jgi:hypothetical protein
MFIIAKKVVFSSIVKVIWQLLLCIGQHIESDVVLIVVVSLEVVELDLSILKPSLSVVKHVIVNRLKVLELMLHITDILFENGVHHLLLNLQLGPHFFELLTQRGP